MFLVYMNSFHIMSVNMVIFHLPIVESIIEKGASKEFCMFDLKLKQKEQCHAFHLALIFYSQDS